MSKKKIRLDIDTQVKELKKLQDLHDNNKVYVANQLVTASKLAGLSTPLVIEDVSHLIDDYETLDVVEVTNAISEVAFRRKEAEEKAIKEAEERIRREEQAKAEAKAREKIAKAKELEEVKQPEEPKETFVTPEEPKPTFVSVEESKGFISVEESKGFVSVEEVQQKEALTVIRVTCKKSETIDIIRLLATNGFDCEVDRNE